MTLKNWIWALLAVTPLAWAQAQAPAGEVKGTAVVHTAESARAVMEKAALVLPARVTGGAVYVLSLIHI